MSIPMERICRAELIKLGKRKDWLSLLAVLGTGILFAASILTDSYAGAEKQSALYWIVTQMLNASILFIAPMILAYSAVRTMAWEIENGTLKVFDEKVRNREKLYLAKSAALWIYSTLLFAACVLIHLAIYFLVVCRSQRFASGRLTGENTALLLCVLFTLYLSTFVLIPQLTLWAGTFAGQGLCIGLLFLLVLAAHNTYKIPVLGVLSPWRSIVLLANDVLNTTACVDMPAGFMLRNVLAQTGLCGTLCVVCLCCGMRLLRKRDL